MNRHVQGYHPYPRPGPDQVRACCTHQAKACLDYGAPLGRKHAHTRPFLRPPPVCLRAIECDCVRLGAIECD